MGFPEHLAGPGQVVSDTQAYRQFGNAVVPAVIKAVARQVVTVMRAAVVAKSANGCILKSGSGERRNPDVVTKRLSQRKPR